MKRFFFFLILLFGLAACRNADVPATENAGNDANEVATAVATQPAAPSGNAMAPAAAGGATAPAGSDDGATAVLPPPTGDPVVDAIIAGLQGLELAQFFDASYRELLLRDPEVITQAGLVELFGTDNNRLADLSDAYLRQTETLERAILDMLRSYDHEALPPDMQLSYDIYEWYLADLIAGHAYAEFDYPATFMINGVHLDTTRFFTDIHPIGDRQDVEDYIARLSQIDTKFEQLIAGLQRREAAGVVPPRFVIQWTLPGIYDIANAQPRRSPFYTALVQKMALLSSVDPPAQDELLDAAEKVIADEVIPAFQDLADYLEFQRGIATEDDGVWKLPDGAAYYSYLLQHYTTTDMTAAEIHELGLQEVSRIQAEMEILFAELGYPAGESLPQLMARVAQDGGTLYGDDIVAGYETIIADASEGVGVAFDLQPTADVIVRGVPQGDYYVRPAIDGSRPGVFYATKQGSEAVYGMPTLAYHEAIPGHHFQLAIMQELTGVPAFRTGVSFTVFAEGWALYAERLAYELGFYAEDPYGNIGRLQGELFRAVRLVVDTGIHAQGWTFSEAVDYMVANTGYDRAFVEGQVARYIVWPGQAVSYMMGMLGILELRQRVEDALGENYDLKAFHNLVLQNGSVPLPILERIVDDLISENQGE